MRTILRIPTPHDSLKAVGGLSKPSKMPCYGFSIPAQYCRTGAVLRSTEGSVCEHCYACKGRYMFPNVQAALERRYRALQTALQGPWSAWETYLGHWDTILNWLEAKGETHFRWHDSGDLQSAAHGLMVCTLAARHPGIRFWLPTKEYALASRLAEEGLIPSNLTVRLSRPMVGQPCPIDPAGPLVYSSVRTKGTDAAGWETACPAPLQGGECRDCRACWDRDCKAVSYAAH